MQLALVAHVQALPILQMKNTSCKKKFQFFVLNITTLKVPAVQLTLVPSVSAYWKELCWISWVQRGCELSASQRKACKLLKELSCKGHCVLFHSCLTLVALFASTAILLPQQPTETLHCGSDLGFGCWFLIYIYYLLPLCKSHKAAGGLVIWVGWCQILFIYFSSVASYS